ncbi:MAG: hypothetical protein ACQSGP_22125 [Frankia sp.]
MGDQVWPAGILGTTPSQTVGPFLAIVLAWPDGPDIAAPLTPGRTTTTGRLTDGAGAPVPDEAAANATDPVLSGLDPADRQLV